MLEPIERNIEISLPANTASIYDSGRLLSLVNRKSFRQGMEYAFDNIEVFTTTAESGNVGVYRIPYGWVQANSWVKAFSHWKQQQDEAAEESGSEATQAGYRDFKIYYNQGHWSGEYETTPYVEIDTPVGWPTKANMLARDSTVNYEWFHSQVVQPNVGGVPGATQEVYFGMIGGDTGGVNGYRGMIHNYALSRSRPHSPDPNIVMPNTSGGLYQEMIDVGMDTEEILSNYRGRNNEPPYYLGVDSNYENYPYGSIADSYSNMTFGSLVDRLIIRAGTSAFATDSTGPFTAYCGLVLLINNSAGALTAIVRHTQGTYNGVAARPMQDVN